ncbi:MAG: M67 family metallopeptidase [Bacteroidales bacterium]|jgi:proteasome lid subunit RPN8/RPN11|nr:M67 family metallopeptidase [Bacteroidales bacterium]
MIRIPQHIIEAMIAHARAELPDEACGLLTGTCNEVRKQHTLTNIDHSPEHFSFDPQEQFRVLKEARREGLKIVACYHSHPSTPARPSEEDIRLAYDPSIIYVIVSLAADEPEVKAFSIIKGTAQREEIT